MGNTMIENLDLVRAKHAYTAATTGPFSGKNDGEVVKKLPPMIRENGLLGALAFALEGKDKTRGYRDALDTICLHLNVLNKVKSSNAEALLNELIEESNSLKLRDVTTEAMLYLNYLRRFAKNK